VNRPVLGLYQLPELPVLTVLSETKPSAAGSGKTEACVAMKSPPGEAPPVAPTATHTAPVQRYVMPFGAP